MTSILNPQVAQTIKELGLSVEEMECDPSFADTAAFNEKYGFSSDESANSIIISSKKVDPARYCMCVVLASTKLDVNKAVIKAMEVKKASFADADITRELTGMEIGGVTAVGVEGLQVFIDSRVMDKERVVMGGGNRTSKIVLAPSELLKLPNSRVIENLAKPQ
jgi:prolyl-tRNA editing enzyme YbaK/EbsC (Cys-tRNA(Pro) deacylase)